MNQTESTDTYESDTERMGVRRQIHFSNQLNKIRVLAKAAEANVRREDYSDAKSDIAELKGRIEAVEEDYPDHPIDPDTDRSESD